MRVFSGINPLFNVPVVMGKWFSPVTGELLTVFQSEDRVSLTFILDVLSFSLIRKDPEQRVNGVE